jgi:hypothetical protein
MKSPEVSKQISTRIIGFIGKSIFKYLHGRSSDQEEHDQDWSALASSMPSQDDVTWIKQRQAELYMLPSPLYSDAEKYKAVYGRARLEAYCRQQATLPDGRLVMQLPVYGADKEALTGLGITVDTLKHGVPDVLSAENYIAILPKGWTMRPADIMEDDSTLSEDALLNDRWASVYDPDQNPVITVLYNSAPNGEDLRSYTRILEQ